MIRIAVAVTIAALAAAPAYASKKPPAAWQVMRATDPITRASTCAVVASDYVGKMRFTQTGALYPVVEQSSVHGLLVGVSSGGRYRLPTGDIFWAIDDKPYRELKAADNPGPAPSEAPVVPQDTVAAMTAQAMRMTYAMTATSTMASGQKAREMLAEMLTGQSLLFRAAAPSPQFGLPNYSALRAGQITSKGELRPIPLDTSFRDGLMICGISGPADQSSPAALPPFP